jgi:hypothetical protein
VELKWQVNPMFARPGVGQAHDCCLVLVAWTIYCKRLWERADLIRTELPYIPPTTFLTQKFLPYLNVSGISFCLFVFLPQSLEFNHRLKEEGTSMYKKKK